MVSRYEALCRQARLVRANAAKPLPASMLKADLANVAQVAAMGWEEALSPRIQIIITARSRP